MSWSEVDGANAYDVRYTTSNGTTAPTRVSASVRSVTVNQGLLTLLLGSLGLGTQVVTVAITPVYDVGNGTWSSPNVATRNVTARITLLPLSIGMSC